VGAAPTDTVFVLDPHAASERLSAAVLSRMARAVIVLIG
jgi:hypothetical protein